MSPEEQQKILDEYRSLERQLADPAFGTNSETYIVASKRFSELAPCATLMVRIEKCERRLKENSTLVTDDVHPDLRTLALQEREGLEQERDQAERELEDAWRELQGSDGVMPRHKKIIVEIRAGTGGDEAALFARDLAKMYQRYAALKGFDVTVVHENRDELGGYKEIVFEMTGAGTYDAFQCESGVHRVQRIPETEKAGRIHTSTATVAVLPVFRNPEVGLQEKDLQIEFFRSSGPGGQNVNKLETAVRVKHVPTGIVVACQSQRYQRQNREKALEILKSKLYQKKLEEQDRARTSSRRQQVGSGDRSEKVRTYNFPQDRITDHRVNRSWKNISRILNGDLDLIRNAFTEQEGGKTQRL